METGTTQKYRDDQELDLKKVYNNINKLFKTFVFNIALFLKTHATTIFILIIVGFALGSLADYFKKRYINEITVTPNFGSSDLLYSKIDLLTAKIEEEDTVFLKSIGFKEPNKIVKISIRPVLDIYDFASEKPQNMQLLELMGEDGDLNKIISDRITSKNFPFHVISVVMKSKTTEDKVIKPLLVFLNKSEYYDKVRKESLENIEREIRQKELSVLQINGILNSFSDSSNNSKGDKLIYYSEGRGLNEIVLSKDSIMIALGKHRINKAVKDKTIKESNLVLNILETKPFTKKMKYMFPIFLILGFVLFKKFSAIYKEEHIRREG